MPGSSLFGPQHTQTSKKAQTELPARSVSFPFQDHEIYVKVAFFRGALLRPVPPGPSKTKSTRYLDIHEDDQIDDAQLVDWIKQASKLPGERM